MARNRVSLLSRLLPGSFALLLVVGCGGTGTISGTVSFKPINKKLASGSVMVLASDNLPRYGAIGKDGRYKVDGVPSGTVKVTVTCPDPRGFEVGAGKPSAGPSSSSANEESIDKNWFAIPEKYGDPARSGLTIEVKRGKNRRDLALD